MCCATTTFNSNFFHWFRVSLKMYIYIILSGSHLWNDKSLSSPSHTFNQKKTTLPHFGSTCISREPAFAGPIDNIPKHNGEYTFTNFVDSIAKLLAAASVLSRMSGVCSGSQQYLRNLLSRLSFVNERIYLYSQISTHERISLCVAPIMSTVSATLRFLLSFRECGWTCARRILFRHVYVCVNKCALTSTNLSRRMESGAFKMRNRNIYSITLECSHGKCDAAAGIERPMRRI